MKIIMHILFLGLLVSLLSMSSPALAAKTSLFFTRSQLIEIMKANAGFIEAKDKNPNEEAEKQMKQRMIDPGPRTIVLSGIVYHGPGSWTIWLNGHRVTPKNIPKEIKELNVFDEYIQLRWMDRGTNRILNLTLKSHQKYNIDTNTLSLGE